MTRSWRAALAAALLAGGAGPGGASAGPPFAEVAPPVDADDDPDAGTSDFWERVLEPSRASYDNLIELGVRQLADRDRVQREAGEATLRDAIALEPRRPLGHVWLGRALSRRGDHAACAAALEAARALDPSFRPPTSEWPQAWALDHELGLCQARAGALEAGERTFAALVERGVEEAPVLERLADVQMALGRLDDAHVALERAARAAPLAASPEFALAVAADRDEDLAAAREHLDRAISRDPRLTTLTSSARAYAPLSDQYYYLGLALEHLGDRPRALFHFRRYLAETESGKEPWRARARAHQTALGGGVLGADLAVRGSATLDAGKAGKAIAASAAAFEACLAPTPALLLRVVVTRTVGDDPAAVTGFSARPGVRVTVLEQHGLGEDALVATIDCVEDTASKLGLPRLVGEPGTYAAIEFSVIAR